MDSGDSNQVPRTFPVELHGAALILRLAAISVVIAGIAGSLALTRLLKSLLYEVSATDPLIFGAVSLGLIAVSIVAMSIPARRATRVDPLDALRQE